MISSARRSFVILSVLVIVTSVLLLVTGLIFIAQAEAAGAAAVHRGVQARGLGWSGIQVVMSQLSEQRDRVLDGEALELDEEYTIYETGGRLGVVRLLPLTVAGEVLVAEAGRLDLNHVDAETLTATELVDSETAAAIVRTRSGLGRPFQSVAELLEVPGVTPQLLYGPLEDLADIGTAILDAGPGAEDEPRGLADVVTVYGHGPAIQRSGTRRIHLDVPYSEDLGRRCDDRFGRGTSAIIKAVLENGSLTEERQLIEAFAQQDTPPEDWPDLVDALTAEPGSMHFGRLDLNTASFDALRAMQGIDPAQAQQIVDARTGMSPEDRATIAWPVIEGIFTPEAYAPLADSLTTRSWTYRVRVEAGEVNADEPDGPLDDAVVWEAVIDLSDGAPRVAYLRDVSLLTTAARLGQDFMVDDAEREDAETEADDDPDPDDDAVSSGPEADSTTDPGPTTTPRPATGPGPGMQPKRPNGTRAANPASETRPDSHAKPRGADGSGRRGRRVGRWVTR